MDDVTSKQLWLYLDAANALLDAMSVVLHAQKREPFHYASYKVFIRKYNQLVQEVGKLVQVDGVIDLYDLDRIPGSHDTTGIHQQELFHSVHANLLLFRAFLENRLDVKQDRILGLIDFLIAHLRKAIFAIPERESEVQNAVEQLLIGRGMEKGIDYDRETGRVKVSIKEVIPDFIFPKLGLALEIKLSKDKDKSKAIVDQINADIMAYGKQYRSILFVVYDLGTIRDEAEFKADLEKADGVSVIVVKH